MRWVGLKPQVLLGRLGSSPAVDPAGRRLSTSSSSSSSSGTISLSSELGIVQDIRTILDTLPGAMEAHLEALAPLLTPHVVSAVLEDSPAVRPAFRFFVWTARRKSLRSWLSHNLVISMLRGSGGGDGSGFDSAWETLEELRGDVAAGVAATPPLPAPAFEVLISAYAAEGRTDKAVECFQRMVAEFGSRPNTFTYNTLILILIRERMSLLAQALYSHMLKVDCRPNRSTYTILIDGLCKGGKTDDALALFDQMSQRHIAPSTLVYTVVLSGLCRAKRIDDANRLLDSMTQNGFRPDSVTYSALIDGFCKLGYTDKGFELARLITEEGSSVSLHAYSSLINGLFRDKKFVEAFQCYRMMLEEKVSPDCVLYTIMMKGYMEAGQIEDAFAFLGEMTDRGIVPDTCCYNTLIKGLCDMGLLDRARHLLLEISNNKHFPDARTYTIMICGLCDQGLVHEAQKIFEEMGKYGCTPTVVTFNSLIKGLCEAKMPEEGRNLLYKMEMGKNQHLFLRLSQGPNPVSDHSSLRREVERLCESGHPVEAYKLLRGLADSGAVPDIATYNILIRGFCKVNSINVATALFQELRFKGYTPDDVTYVTLVSGYLRMKKVDKAIELFYYLVRNRFGPMLRVYNIIMVELCKTSRVWQAVSLWFYYISQRKSNLSAEEAELMAVAQKLSEQGSVGESVRCLLEMGDYYDFPSPLPYANWMIGFCKVGQMDEAFDIFALLMEHNISVASHFYSMLIHNFCREGRVDLAQDMMIHSLNNGILFPRPVGNRLLAHLWDHSKKDALKLACRMSRAGYVLDIHLHEIMQRQLHNYGLSDDS